MNRMQAFAHRLILLICVTVAMAFQSKATHIVGGEMNYRYLGSNNYEIRLTVYRDCYLGVPLFDDPAILGIFDKDYNYLDSAWISFRELDTLPATINSPCMVPITDFCYEVTTYVDTINLPPLAGGYYITYQRCCRNTNILNIVDPGCVGASYWAFIPGPEVSVVNSNPDFINQPPPFICISKPWVFDHSAADADGDSLVYELFTPYDGLSSSCPVLTPASPTAPSSGACPGSPSSCPTFPVPPPFPSLIWEPPFNLSNVLGGIPLAIDPQTGVLTATPNTLGYFVYGVKCKEYRNGILLSETLRDYQLIVKDCPSLVAASVVAPSVFCGSPTVDFANNSTGAGTYTWFFGDPTTTADSSNSTTPSYTYPGSGAYDVILVAYAPGNPACNDTAAVTVSIFEDFSGNFSWTTENCDPNKVRFTSTNNGPEDLVMLNWNFGNQQVSGQYSDSISTTATSGTYGNPIHTYPENAATYPVTLVLTIPGSSCVDTLQSATVSTAPASNFFVPNSFTPNGDGNNDVFRVRGPAYKQFYFAVYNRWGELIFETDNPAVGWDGTWNGMPADPGVFGYYVRYSCSETEEEEFHKGNVTLIR